MRYITTESKNAAAVTLEVRLKMKPKNSIIGAAIFCQNSPLQKGFLPSKSLAYMRQNPSETRLIMR